MVALSHGGFSHVSTEVSMVVLSADVSREATLVSMTSLVTINVKNN